MKPLALATARPVATAHPAGIAGGLTAARTGRTLRNHGVTGSMLIRFVTEMLTASPGVCS